jgi:ribosome recycling factor
MEKLKDLFHTKTPKEMMQENKRAIRRARRELEREKNRLNNEKTRNENEIRKLAAKGEQVFFLFLQIHLLTKNIYLESITNICEKYC